ncbi:MAG: hypothetical protein IJW53_00190 [Clostridia bacterium]|nr:hypothetical protein [Clostridia bacterium]
MKNVIHTSLSLALIAALMLGSINVHASDTGSAKDEIPYTSHDTSVAEQTYDSVITEYYGQDGIDAGVPEGFSGYALKLAPKTDSGHAGVCVDYSDQNIPIDSVEQISFRVYIPSGGASEFRIMNKAKASSWIVRATPSAFSAWVDVVLDNTSGFMSGFSLDSLANSEGNLGSFCIIFRLKSPSESAAYIDSVSIKYKEGASDDLTPPVINYNGPTELTASEGEKLSIEGLSAFDEYDNSSATISYEWSAGAANSLGELQAGTHTCKVIATDRSGNESFIELRITVKASTSLIRLESVPFVPHDTSIADTTYDGKYTELTEAEAESKGIANGYNGTVYEISYNSGKSYIGVCLDFSGYEIPIGIVDSISFKVLMPTSYSELRMRNGNTTDWIMRCSSAPTGEWNTVVLSHTGSGFFGSSSMDTLVNSDGNLGAFCLIGRNSGTYANYYIDSVVIKLKDDDKCAPVLNYDGETDILTSSGKPFEPGITAYDEFEGRYVDVEYAWSEGALDSKGNMLEGEHTCVVSATDYYGNRSTLTLNVTVGPPDTEAPEILFETSEIYVSVGTYCRMVISCVDNYDKVDVVSEWSDGAIDLGGRLYEGTHTLTLTATDLSGNKTVHVVTVYVTDTDTTVGQLIECGKAN